MKNQFLLLICFFSFLSIQAQDIICTHNNEFLEVKIKSIEDQLVFYTESDNPEIKTINHSQIKAIQWNSKSTAEDEKQLTKVGEESGILVNNFSLIKNNNDTSKNAWVATGVLGLITATQFATILDCIFCDDPINPMRVYVPLAGTIVSGIIAIAKRKKSDYTIQSNKELNPTTHIYELRNQPLKPAVNDVNLTNSTSGLGLQFNF